MSNIIRRDPFAIDEAIDDLLKGFWVRPMRYSADMPELQTIRMDMKEGDKEYTVHAELPGVGKDDIHVTVDGNRVAIAAEVKKASEQKASEKVLRSERYCGKAYRSFTLGQDVDDANTKARFENGVLELVLPKKTVTTAKKVRIE